MAAINGTVSKFWLNGKEFQTEGLTELKVKCREQGKAVHYGVDMGSEEKVAWTSCRPLSDGTFEMTMTIDSHHKGWKRFNKYMGLHSMRALYEANYVKHYHKNGQRLKIRIVKKRFNKLRKTFQKIYRRD